MKDLNTNLKVSFYLKKNINRNDVCPVMGRISIGKDMIQFSCKFEADPKLWNTRAGRMTGKSNYALTINRKIDKINVAVNAKYREIVSLRGKATANDVKNAFQGNAMSQETLLKIFREYNEAFKKRVGVNRTKSTFNNYHFSYLSLEQFIKKKYRVTDLSFRQLDYYFIEKFYFYLKIDCGLAAGTIIIRLSHLRKMIKLAIRKRIISHNPFAGFCSEGAKAKQRYVPKEELEKLIKTHLKSKSLDITRDMFLFSCYTGLSYIDLYKLSNRQIEKENDGFLWINTSRQKTDNESKILLLDEALRLIEKYRGTGSGDKVFPMKSCGHINGQLKTIATLCNIEKRLTFHMARHTFATEICLSQGISIESIGRMMGHKDPNSTEIYAKITSGKMSEDMQMLSEKLKDMYAFAS